MHQNKPVNANRDHEIETRCSNDNRIYELENHTKGECCGEIQEHSMPSNRDRRPHGLILLETAIDEEDSTNHISDSDQSVEPSMGCLPRDVSTLTTDFKSSIDSHNDISNLINDGQTYTLGTVCGAEIVGYTARPVASDTNYFKNECMQARFDEERTNSPCLSQATGKLITLPMNANALSTLTSLLCLQIFWYPVRFSTW